MLNRLLSLFLSLVISIGAHAQDLSAPALASPRDPASAQASLSALTLARTPAPLPSPEEFVDEVCHTVVDSSMSRYYLLAGADTCRFVRYNYDEWANYHLLEPVPISILNELAEKVYLSRYPYFWKQAALPTATLITSRQADSLLYLNPPNGDGTVRHLVFSFSLPQFTDDGQYAVIDLNMVCGGHCGLGSTYIFHLTSKGWKMIGAYRNWSA